MGKAQRFSQPLFDFCHASKFDARKEPQGGRLHRGGSTVQSGRPCRRETPLRSGVRKAVAFSLSASFAQKESPRRFIFVSGRSVLCVNRQCSCDVWPNIMGVITCQQGSAASGAIEIIDATGGTVVTGNLKNVQANRLNASLYSSVFSKSSTVQPPALRLLPCIKF